MRITTVFLDLLIHRGLERIQSKKVLSNMIPQVVRHHLRALIGAVESCNYWSQNLIALQLNLQWETSLAQFHNNKTWNRQVARGFRQVSLLEGVHFVKEQRFQRLQRLIFHKATHFSRHLSFLSVFPWMRSARRSHMRKWLLHMYYQW